MNHWDGPSQLMIYVSCHYSSVIYFTDHTSQDEAHVLALVMDFPESAGVYHHLHHFLVEPHPHLQVAVQLYLLLMEPLPLHHHLLVEALPTTWSPTIIRGITYVPCNMCS